jgi:hypothetical protein
VRPKKNRLPAPLDPSIRELTLNYALQFSCRFGHHYPLCLFQRKYQGQQYGPSRRHPYNRPPRLVDQSAVREHQQQQRGGQQHARCTDP